MWIVALTLWYPSIWPNGMMKLYKKVTYKKCRENAALKFKNCFGSVISHAAAWKKKTIKTNFTLTDYYNSLHFLDLLAEKCMDKVETSTCKWRVQNGHACSLGYMKYECFKTCVCGMFYFSQTLNSNKTITNILRIISNYWMRLSRIWRIMQIEEDVINRGNQKRRNIFWMNNKWHLFSLNSIAIISAIASPSKSGTEKWIQMEHNKV